MPPKAARGATRGRGRGRGKASASEDTNATAGLLGDISNESSSQSTLDESSLPVAKMTTPQHLLDDSSAPSPNSSPVSIPTETPAPTPARVPIPRSEPNIASTSASHTAGPSTRGGRGGARGAKPATTSRFKPKNVRSDANKLEEIRLKEQAKLDELAAERRREENRLLRGRGRPARGRGDVMGRRAGTASGIFSIAPEALSTFLRNQRWGSMLI
jgi:DNA-directed RNA polymerase III subunit RPC4